MSSIGNEIVLSAEEIPKKWYNILCDLPEKLPPPKEPEDEKGSRMKLLSEVMIGECLKQENSESKFVDIPEDVLELYRQAGRPRQ
ncbi:MAG: TrpB-like pyridoxal-phosphate dependent enzyme, partial [Candidatus Thermoplasmatota archaeon]